MDNSSALQTRRPRVKICGLSTEAAIEAVLSRGGQEIGFVSFDRSPRHLGVEAIARLRAVVGERALVTVVTVDPTDEFLDDLLRATRPDFIQLHGRETPERVAEIARRTGLSTMKAIPVAGPDDLVAIDVYRGVADRILLDAKAPKGADLPGGNGLAFDWSILSGPGAPKDIVLSGGLNPANVAEAIRIARPSGIDVSSGVESAPGVKDIDLIHRFFDALDASSSSELQRRAS